MFVYLNSLIEYTHFGEIYSGRVGRLQRLEILKVKYQRTWFQHRSCDKVKKLIRSTKGLEVNNPSDI
jgi:hypothetical protein